MSVRLTPAARRDLDGIWSFTIERWGEDQAEMYLRTLAQAFADLAEGTRPGRSAHDVREGYWRLPVESHVVFYRKPEAGGIEVIRILHKHMDVERHL